MVTSSATPSAKWKCHFSRWNGHFLHQSSGKLWLKEPTTGSGEKARRTKKKESLERDSLSLLSDSNQRPRDYKSRALANWAKEARWESNLHRAATTSVPLLRSSPGGFRGSKPYRTFPYLARAKVCFSSLSSKLFDFKFPFLAQFGNARPYIFHTRVTLHRYGRK